MWRALDTLDLRLRSERIFAGLGFDRSSTDPLYDAKAWNARLLTDLADAVAALDSAREAGLCRVVKLSALWWRKTAAARAAKVPAGASGSL